MTYSIGEVAKMLNVSTQSLRSWERQGFIPECPRSPTNRRQYSDEGIKAIKDYWNEVKGHWVYSSRPEVSYLPLPTLRRQREDRVGPL